MNTKQAEKYLQGYLDGTASNEQKAFVESWQLEYPIDDRDILDQELKEADLAEIRANLVKLSNPGSTSRTLWTKIVLAAAAVAAIMFGIWFYQSSTYFIGNEDNWSILASHIKPGKNKATLTLANGKTINLSDTRSGVVINAAKLSYNDGTAIASRATKELIAATPRGGTYQVTLPDGSKVWLNAASSLKFPSSFSGLASRKVELLEGEAYFEVIKDKSHPFMVSSRGQEVEVLGTHFNINSYPDENATTTTLLEGAVKIGNLNSKKSYLLKPGQQSVLKAKDTRIAEVSTKEVIAWKNGDFLYTEASLENIMSEISRWYNVDVEFRDDTKKAIPLGFYLARSSTIAKVLKVLESTELAKFSIENNKIIVK